MLNHQDVCDAPTIPGTGLPLGCQRVLQKPAEQDALEMLVRVAVLGGEVGSAYPDHKAVIGLLNEIAKVRTKLGLMVRCPIPGGTEWERLDEKVNEVLTEMGNKGKGKWVMNTMDLLKARKQAGLNPDGTPSSEINPWVYQEGWKLSIRLHTLAGRQLPDRPAGISPERWMELVQSGQEDAAETQVNLLSSPYKNLQELQAAYEAELPLLLEKIEPVLRVLR